MTSPRALEGDPGQVGEGREPGLTPSPWRLEDEPPTPEADASGWDSGEPPWLLQIDRRQPLAAAVQQQLSACLSPEEHRRHAAYRLPADRERFLLGRGALRRLLGAWLHLTPQAVPLMSDLHGKPRCPGGPHFNVSHSGELILLALHPVWPVGVDVERLRPALDWRAIAARMLTPAELQALAALPEAQRTGAFLRAWCRLEARLKCRGDGLAGLERLRTAEAAEALPERCEPSSLAAGASSEQQPGPGGSGEPCEGQGEPARPHLHRPACRAAPDGRRGWRATTGELVWDVLVPAGYRAAVALAPGNEL